MAMSTPQTVEKASPLTKYPSASLRELFKLSLPLILVLLSSCLMGFCDRLFLAHYSLEAFEGCVNAVYICLLFQLPCIRITSMAQIFTGLHKGAGHLHLIGPCVWQMIWFSLFSMLLTLPLSLWVGPFFLGQTPIEQPAMTYFQTLMTFNFLFPLGAALSSFFMAEGNTKPLVIATLASQILNALLDYLLIFGVPGLFEAQGILGAAIATGIAQGTFCLFLFFLFLQRRHRLLYGSHLWALRWKTFWNCTKVGIPRAMARLMILVVWAAISRIMTLKGGDYLIVLSIGGTLFFLFAFINEGMGQALMTIASRLIGAKEYLALQKLRHSAFLFLAVVASFLIVPFLIFPDLLLASFFKEPPSAELLTLLHKSCRWVWFLLICNGINVTGASFIAAACDTVFHMLVNCLTWFTCYLPIYLFIQLGNASPDSFWLLACVDTLILGLLFLKRANRNNTQPALLEKCHLNLLA